jgi:hypothetical protein
MEHPKGVKAPGDCKCYAAVMRAYSEMLKSKYPEKVACEAAFRVYRFHHPEHALDPARLTVESWLYAGQHH